jgi:hypothetical protein
MAALRAAITLLGLKKHRCFFFGGFLIAIAIL